MSSPLRILFEQPGGRRGLAVPVGSALARAVGLVLLAEALVRAIVSAGDPALWWTLGLLGAGLRGAGLWIDEQWGTRAAAAAHGRLRSSILTTLLRGRARARASTAVAVTRGVDDLEDYFTTVVPALSAAAVVPATLLVRIVFTDALSAVIIAACLPLVPVFMVLIGRYTADSTAATTTALARMSDHLAELAAGLPVLIGVGRSRDHARALRKLGADYHSASLTTLRIAFLSSLALELIATISVALVAVVIGLRLVSGSMDLASGLFVLLLAPECFIPLRQLGAGFHASENGRDAYDRAREIIAGEQSAHADTADADAADTGSAVPAGTVAGPPADAATEAMVESGGPAGRVVHGDGTTITWTGEIPAAPGVTAITGPTGAGKSSVLAALTGTLPRTSATSAVQLDCAYVPQTPRFFAETVGEELAVFGLDPARAREELASANLGIPASTPIAALSPGQQRRLALVRTAARVDAGAEVLVLDEPTAHLDEESAALVIGMIAAASTRLRIVLASHDEHVLDLADHEIAPRKTAPEDVDAPAEVGAPADVGAPAVAPGSAEEPAPVGGESAPVEPAVSAIPAATPHSARGTVDPRPADGLEGAHRPDGGRGSAPAPGSPRRRWSALRASMPLLRRDMVLALLASCAASLAAIALTAVSAWLIVEASHQPPIMTLLVAIVGVRFFGLSRSLLQYLSRLTLHSAIFASLTALRSRLWAHFERSGSGDRTLLTSDTALRTMIADADDLRDLVPRTLVPPIVALMVVAAIITTTGLLLPTAVPILLVLAGLGLLLVPALLVRAQAPVAARIRSGRARILSLVTRALAATVDLTANRAAGSVLDRLATTEADLADAQSRSARMYGAAQLAIQVATAAAAVAVAATSSAPTGVLAVVVLMTVGLTDVLSSSLTAWRALPQLGLVLDRLPVARGHVGADDEDPAAQPTAAGRAPRLTSLALEGITVGWEERAVVEDLDLRADVDRWTVVVGESGSGKSTTVGVLLRFLDPWSGRYRAGTTTGQDVDVLGFAAAEVAGALAWCPQEAHVFRSTVRGNLAIAREQTPNDSQMCDALTRAGLGEWANAQGLDRWVGDRGAEISGGQRQRLAVARTILSGAGVIVLDEPTAHLDRATAAGMLARLRQGLVGHTVVLVTHDRRLIEPDDRVVDLGAGRLSPASSRT